MDEQAKKLQQAAQTILYHSRKKLALDHPAFVSAVYLLPEQECPAPGPLWTDGRTLYYHPATVVADFSGHKNAIANDAANITACAFIFILLRVLLRRPGESSRL